MTTKVRAPRAHARQHETAKPRRSTARGVIFAGLFSADFGLHAAARSHDRQRLAPHSPATTSLELAALAPASTVDPLALGRAYRLSTSERCARMFQLLHDALRRHDLVGVGRLCMRGTVRTVIVRPDPAGLICVEHLRRWHADAVDVPSGRQPDFSDVERRLVDQVVAQLKVPNVDAGVSVEAEDRSARRLVGRGVSRGQVLDMLGAVERMATRAAREVAAATRDREALRAAVAAAEPCHLRLVDADAGYGCSLGDREAAHLAPPRGTSRCDRGPGAVIDLADARARRRHLGPRE